MKIQIGNEIRNMTEEEKANYDAVVAKQQALNQELADIAAAATSGRAKLAALGLTEAEVNALLGGA